MIQPLNIKFMLRIVCFCLLVFISILVKADPVFVRGYYDDEGKFHSGYYRIPDQSPMLVNVPFFPVEPPVGYYYPTPGRERSTTNNVGGHLPTAMPNMTIGQRSN